jgi:hypothetical protein
MAKKQIRVGKDKKIRQRVNRSAILTMVKRATVKASKTKPATVGELNLTVRPRPSDHPGFDSMMSYHRSDPKLNH